MIAHPTVTKFWNHYRPIFVNVLPKPFINGLFWHSKLALRIVSGVLLQRRVVFKPKFKSLHIILGQFGKGFDFLTQYVGCPLVTLLIVPTNIVTTDKLGRSVGQFGLAVVGLGRSGGADTGGGFRDVLGATHA